jgi:hypothetical protein
VPIYSEAGALHFAGDASQRNCFYLPKGNPPDTANDPAGFAKLYYVTPVLFEIRRAAFKALTLFTFGNILYLAVFEKGLHFDFPTTGTKELLGGACGTRVFTGLSHRVISLPYTAFLYRTI